MMHAGRFREPIDPFAYSHRCDNAATYVPRQRPVDKKNWQKVTDTTGRGYGDPKRTTAGCVKATREQLPRPDMQSLLTQHPSSLDHQNRFFEDNRKRLNQMMVYDEQAQEQPQYSDKKTLASKVTNREFIQMPKAKIVPPKGYRDAVVTKAPPRSALKKQTVTVKDKSIKQVSEVDDQGSAPRTRKSLKSDCQPSSAQVEEKMQKTSQPGEFQDIVYVRASDCAPSQAVAEQDLTVEVVGGQSSTAAAPTSVVAFPQTLTTGLGATEDQQTACLTRPAVNKQEEQDETSSTRPPHYDTVGSADVQAHQSSQVICCKLAARRMLYQMRDPCQQKSSLFQGSLLGPTSDELRNTSYRRFYENERSKQTMSRPAGVAIRTTQIDEEPSCAKCQQY